MTAPAPVAPGRFCFVVTELLGHRTAGGIATATTFLAELLAAAGHEVTLLDASSDLEFLNDAWSSRYRRLGIIVERLRRTQPVSPPYIADSYRTYHQLRDRDFDLIVFQDWRGLGFCSMVAKRCGLAFARARLVHIVHGPTEWLIEANQSIRLDTEQFAVADIERRAAELADTVVGPSRYLLDWMAERWQLGPDRRQIFYPTARMVGLRSDRPASAASGDGPDDASAGSRVLRELVFFGRYEERKGIRVLTDALNRLGANRLAGVRLTFLGRAVPYGTADVSALLDDDVRAAVGGPVFLTDLDSLAARAYLAEPGRVALIPSLIDNSPNVVIECIEDGISFLAAASGGIPELVHPEDRAHVLFEPTAAALADRLGRLLDDGTVVAPARQGWVDEEILPAWEALLAPPAAPDAGAAGAEGPLVSVVIPHHAQLELFRLTLASVVAQDYDRLEIVVVDDGTPDRAMVAALATLLEEPWGRPIKLVRQDNRYLGAARNAGVAVAEGDWLVFVDDDDLVEPNYVSTLVRAALATGADAVSSVLVNHDDDDGGELAGGIGAPYVLAGDSVHLAAVWNTIGGAGCLVTRDAWSAVGGFHTRHGVGHEDWTLLLSIALSGRRVVAVPEPLYRYRIRERSMLRSTSRYRNMRPVFEAYRPVLPPELHEWPEMLHGFQNTIDILRHENAELRSALTGATATAHAHAHALAAVSASAPPGDVDPVAGALRRFRSAARLPGRAVGRLRR